MSDTFSPELEQAKPAIGRVQHDNTTIATCFLVSEHIALTCHHFVTKHQEVTVMFEGMTETPIVATVEPLSEISDLAVLKFTSPVRNLSPISLSSLDHFGESFETFGYPVPHGGGGVSGRGRIVGQTSITKMISNKRQTGRRLELRSDSIRVGFSGAPVLVRSSLGIVAVGLVTETPSTAYPDVPSCTLLHSHLSRIRALDSSILVKDGQIERLTRSVPADDAREGMRQRMMSAYEHLTLRGWPRLALVYEKHRADIRQLARVHRDLHARSPRGNLARLAAQASALADDLASLQSPMAPTDSLASPESGWPWPRARDTVARLRLLMRFYQSIKIFECKNIVLALYYVLAALPLVALCAGYFWQDVAVKPSILTCASLAMIGHMTFVNIVAHRCELESTLHKRRLQRTVSWFRHTAVAFYIVLSVFVTSWLLCHVAHVGRVVPGEALLLGIYDVERARDEAAGKELIHSMAWHQFLSDIKPKIPLLSCDTRTLQNPYWVDVGHHRAAVRRASANKERIATAAKDGSVRIWSRASYDLVRSIPVRSKGEVLAVALSQDGLLALGHDRVIDIYSRKLALLQTIPIPAPYFNDIEFSADGKFMTVTPGPILIEVATGKVAWRGEDCSDDMYGVAISSSSHVAASCYDGSLLVYDMSGSLQAKIVPGIVRPYGVAFSPDGKHVAVGSNRDPEIAVCDLSGECKTHAVDGMGSLMAVAWAADGETIYAAGSYDLRKDQNIKLVTFTRSGQTKVESLGLDNSVFDISLISSSELLLAGAEPTWMIWDIHASSARHVDNDGLLHMNRRRVTLYDEGRRAVFTIKPKYRTSAEARALEFDAGTLTLKSLEHTDLTDIEDEVENYKATSTGENTNVAAHIAEWEIAHDSAFFEYQYDDIIHLDRWIFDYIPELETVRSQIRITDHDVLLVGTEWCLRKFGTWGQIWSRMSYGPAWSMSVSRDGTLLVVLHGDGTLRWYDVGNGAELLAVSVTADHKDFVAWISSGYYATSGGAPIVDTNGRKLPECKHRDDVVKRILIDRDETAALIRADNVAGRSTSPCN